SRRLACRDAFGGTTAVSSQDSGRDGARPSTQVDQNCCQPRIDNREPARARQCAARKKTIAAATTLKMQRKASIRRWSGVAYGSALGGIGGDRLSVIGYRPVHAFDNSRAGT